MNEWMDEHKAFFRQSPTPHTEQSPLIFLEREAALASVVRLISFSGIRQKSGLLDFLNRLISTALITSTIRDGWILN